MNLSGVDAQTDLAGAASVSERTRSPLGGFHLLLASMGIWLERIQVLPPVAPATSPVGVRTGADRTGPSSSDEERKL